ncbi:MAG: ClpX C4-type zinc finger protein [Usitatibacter sp.]
MKKQFRIQINGDPPLRIDLNANEGVYIRIDSNPAKFAGVGVPLTSLHVEGNRWDGDDYYTLDWGQRTLSLNDNVTIQIVGSADAPTSPEREEKYVAPEKDCSFCQKKASEVQFLIDGGIFARICDECVEVCRGVIEAKRAT